MIRTPESSQAPCRTIELMAPEFALKEMEELLRRNEAIAERWEKIQGRYERLLSAMEKQFKVE